MKDQQFQKLRAQSDKEKVCRVVRDGVEQEIPVPQLAVGDVAVVYQGDKIYADGIFIPGNIGKQSILLLLLLLTSTYLNIIIELHVNQSDLTGEAEPILKNKDPVIRAGCTVTTGSGKFLVLGVGK